LDKQRPSRERTINDAEDKKTYPLSMTRAATSSVNWNDAIVSCCSLCGCKASEQEGVERGVVWWQETQAELLRCQKPRTFHGDRNRIKTKTTEKKKRKLKGRGRDID
jgi:hypothetical protein